MTKHTAVGSPETSIDDVADGAGNRAHADRGWEVYPAGRLRESSDEDGGRVLGREWSAVPARNGGSRPISRVLSWAAIHLGRISRCASSNLPGSRADYTFEDEPRCPPIWSCSGRGLPCRLRYRRRGALLPHHFTLTPLARGERGGIFSVALAVGLRLPGVTWRPVLWSPDFPPSRETPEQRLPGQLLGRV